MKICIAGKNNIAVDVCTYIMQTYPSIPIIAIPNRTDKGIDGYQRSFLKFIKEKGVPIVELNDVYSMPDCLFLSLEFDRIIKPALFSSKRLFNIHFSLLPEYKGMYTSALPILHGKKKTGVTLHRIESGIDTGDIIEQKSIIIQADETARSLYFKYIRTGTDLVINNIPLLLSDNIKSYPQPAEKSIYYSKFTIDYLNLKLDFNVTAYQLSQQIRAYNFRAYQLPTINGIPVIGSIITKTKSISRPGTIAHEDDDFIVVSTIDYDLCVIKDRFEAFLRYCKEDNLTKLKSIPNIEYYIFEAELTHGWTGLMVAAYYNSTSVCKFLISHGADINAQNYNGTTVIMYAKDVAVNTNDILILDMLLEAGADPYISDFGGRNLLDYLKCQSSELYIHVKNRLS